MGADSELLRVLGSELDEKARRLTLGAVARAAGDGGIGAVARLTGAAWQTVANGAAELGSGEVAPDGRVRRAGAGRPKLSEADPGLLALVEEPIGKTNANACSGERCNGIPWFCWVRILRYPSFERSRLIPGIDHLPSRPQPPKGY
jgi:hypothetical protein